jgi:hypothetical protein
MHFCSRKCTIPASQLNQNSNSISSLLDLGMMKYFYALLILCTVSVASAASLTSGNWVLSGVRTCTSGDAISDSVFTNNVSDYAYKIAGNKLTLTMKFDKTPITFEYTLSALPDGRTLATPTIASRGSYPFQLSEKDQIITAYFTDSDHNSCAHGEVATAMKLE